jgi:hypothetical protein
MNGEITACLELVRGCVTGLSRQECKIATFRSHLRRRGHQKPLGEIGFAQSRTVGFCWSAQTQPGTLIADYLRRGRHELWRVVFREKTDFSGDTYERAGPSTNRDAAFAAD